jgi:hypothetical protein
MKTKNLKTKIYISSAAVLTGCIIIFAAGCEGTDTKSLLRKENLSLRQEKQQLTLELDASAAQVEQLKKQIQTLNGLSADERLENLYNLQKVRLTRYTNLYDRDGDSRYEKLLVYIQPVDEQGDIVKATGAVDVQLWDLNKPQEQSLLGSWHVEPNELKQLWFATLLTINYRLAFDIPEPLDSYEQPLTVKVVFTDYLTGRVFTEQKAIKPSGL